MTMESFAHRAITLLGGHDNVQSVENCMTRVRAEVKNPALCDIESVKKLQDVLGASISGQSVQIVVEPGKSKRFAADMQEALKAAPPSPVSDDKIAEKQKPESRKKHDTPLKRLMKKVEGIFFPILPAFIGCGLMVAIYEAMCVFVPGFDGTDAGKVLYVIAYSIFNILPIIVGYNAAREFGGTPVLGAILGAILYSSAINGINFFGVIDCMAGRGGVIAVMVIAALGAQLEKRLSKLIPDFLDTFLRPLLVIAVMTFLGLSVLQPLCGYLSDGIGFIVEHIISDVPWLAGFVSGFYLPLVMTGMHHGLIAVNAELISEFGVTYLLPVICMAGAGQAGAALLVMLRTKNPRLRRVCKNALPVGLLGIGEPLLWGVTVPLGKPFIASCLGGGVGGCVIAMMRVGAKIPELSGLQLALITDRPINYLLCYGISLVAGFLFAALLGFEDPAD